MVSKAYKFRFYPNRAQEKQLTQDFGCARHVWNHALERRTRAYQENGERLTGVDISREITELKRGERPWLSEATSTVLTQVLRDQEHAFQNFFEGRAKYPKFKKKRTAQSVRYQLDQRQVHRTFSAGEHRLMLPKLGALKLRWSREVKGVPKMVTVKRDACGRYFVSFSCEVEIQPLPEKGTLVGIDFGVKDVVITSDGYKSSNPRPIKKQGKYLRWSQRRLSRKRKGSKGL